MKASVRLVLLCAVCVWGSARAQYDEDRAPRYISNEPKPTPVPILKQINRHNEDGSYTYGYEGADGSFKIETKAQNGEVKGKYGYKDDTGKLRVVEYGADKYGFQPAGEGITVAPPTFVDETTGRDEEQRPKAQGGRSQYRTPAPARQQTQDYDYEEPASPQYQPAPPARPAPQPAYRPSPRLHTQTAPRPPKPAFFSGAAPAPQEQTNFFRPEPQQQFRPTKPDFRSTQNFQPQPQPPQQYQPQPQPPQQFQPQPQPPQQFSPSQYSPNALTTQARFADNGYKSPKATQGFSMLDQLLKEFALPENGSPPLHDITFGSY